MAIFSQKLDKILNDSLELGLKNTVTIQNIDGTTIKFLGNSGSLSKIQIANIDDISLQSITPTNETSNGVSLESMLKFLKWHNVFVDNVNSETSFSGQLAEITTTNGFVRITPSTKSFALSTHNHDNVYMKNWNVSAVSTVPVSNELRAVSNGLTVELHKIAASGIPVFTTSTKNKDDHILTEIPNYTLNVNDIIGVRFINGNTDTTKTRYISLGGIRGMIQTASGETSGRGLYIANNTIAYFVYDGNKFTILGAASSKESANDFGVLGPVFNFPSSLDAASATRKLALFDGDSDTITALTPATSFTTSSMSTECYSSDEIQKIYFINPPDFNNVVVGSSDYLLEENSRMSISAGITTGRFVDKLLTKAGSTWSMEDIGPNMPIYLMLNYSPSGIRIITNGSGAVFFTNNPEAVRDSTYNAFLYIGKTTNNTHRIQLNSSHPIKVFRYTDAGYLEVGHTDHAQLAEDAFNLGGIDAESYALKTDLKHKHIIGLSGDITATGVAVSENGTITLSTTYNNAVPVSKGGTGLKTVAVNGILYGNNSNTMSILAAPTSSSRMILTSKGTGSASTAPLWMTVSELLDEINAVIYKGTLAGTDTAPGSFTPASNNGYLYVVSNAGYINGIKFEAGDMIICNTDDTVAATSSNYTDIAKKWDAVQKNVDGIVTGLPGGSVADNIAVFSDSTGSVIKDSGKSIANIVTGPSSAIDDHIALFSGESGTVLKSSGITISNIVSSILVPTAINSITNGTYNGQLAFTKTDGTNGTISTQKANMVTGVSINGTNLVASLIQTNGTSTNHSMSLNAVTQSIVKDYIVGESNSDIILNVNKDSSIQLSATINSSSNIVRQPAIENMVNGPVSSTAGNLTQFSSTDGKSISDSGKKVSDVVTASSDGVANSIPVYAGNDKTITPSTISISGNTLIGAENIKQQNNVARANLGDPTLAEMSLIADSFSNKMDFFPTDKISFERSTDGTTFITEVLNTNTLKRFVGGDLDIVTPITVPKGNFARLTFTPYTYVYLNMLYLYFSSYHGNIRIKIESGKEVNDITTWTTVTDYTNAINGWPAHATVWHETIPFGSESTRFNKVRITIEALKSGTVSDTNYPNINLYGLKWFGGYPAGKRNIYAVDADKNVAFPAELKGGTLVSTATVGTAPLKVTSTTKVANLNADLLDGLDSTHFLDYNNLTNKKTLSVTEGAAVSGEYIAGISVSDHEITLSRKPLPIVPDITVTSDASSGTLTASDTIVTTASASNHNITLTRKTLPTTAFSDNKVSQVYEPALSITLYDILGSYQPESSSTNPVRAFRNVKVNGKGDLYVGGDLVIGGTTYTENKVSLTTADSMIELMKRSSPTTITGYAGMFVSKYDGTNDGGIFFDANGIAYVGDATLTDGAITDDTKLQPIATRVGFTTNNSGQIPAWNAAENTFAPSGICALVGTAENPIILTSLDFSNTCRKYYVSGYVQLFSTNTPSWAKLSFRHNTNSSDFVDYIDQPIEVSLASKSDSSISLYVKDYMLLPIDFGDFSKGWYCTHVKEAIGLANNLLWDLPLNTVTDIADTELIRCRLAEDDERFRSEPFIHDDSDFCAAYSFTNLVTSTPWKNIPEAEIITGQLPTSHLTAGNGLKLIKFKNELGSDFSSLLHGNLLGCGTTISGHSSTVSTTASKVITPDGFNNNKNMTEEGCTEPFVLSDVINIPWYAYVGSILKIRMHDGSRSTTVSHVNLTATISGVRGDKTFNIKTLNKDTLTNVTAYDRVWEEGDTVSFKVTMNDLVVMSVEKTAKSPLALPDGWVVNKDNSNSLIFTFESN